MTDDERTTNRPPEVGGSGEDSPSPGPAASAAPPSSSSLKESTTDVPMIELKDVIEFIQRIHDGGLEVSDMKAVANSLGYTNPSSTPFYRRMNAGRLFGLIAKPSGASLTPRGLDVLKPSREGAREDALRDAILEVPAYREQVTLLEGKKVNLVFVANAFARSLTVTPSCAQACARVFEFSLGSAGLVAADGTIRTKRTPPEAIEPTPTKAGQEKVTQAESIDTQSHTLFLDKQKQRRFEISAPLEVSPAEFARIKRWLEAVLNVNVESEGT